MLGLTWGQKVAGSNPVYVKFTMKANDSAVLRQVHYSKFSHCDLGRECVERFMLDKLVSAVVKTGYNGGTIGMKRRRARVGLEPTRPRRLYPPVVVTLSTILPER